MAEKKTTQATAAGEASPTDAPAVNVKIMNRKQARARRFKAIASINQEGDIHVNTNLTGGLRDEYGASLQRYNHGIDVPSGRLYLILTGMEDKDAYPIQMHRSGKTCTMNVRDALPEYNVHIPKGKIAKVPAEVLNVPGLGICLALNLIEVPLKDAKKRPPKQNKGAPPAAHEPKETQAKDGAALGEQKAADAGKEPQK